MSEGGEYWSPSGRHRPDRDDYGDEHEVDAARDYGGSARYGPEDSEAYWGSGYEGVSASRDRRGYGDRPRYDDPLGYGERAGYGEPDYGESGYGEPAAGGYGEGSHADRAASGYGPGGYAEPATGGYGQRSRYAEPGYGATGYDETGYDEAAAGGYAPRSGWAEPGYREPAGAGYGEPAADRYAGTGGYGEHEGAGGRRYHEPYDQRDDGRSFADPQTGPFDRGADTGAQAGWAFQPDTAGYDPEPLGDPLASPYSMPDAGSFGRANSGSFRRPDTGSSARTDSGSFSRQDSGSFSGQDSGSFSGQDSGSFPSDHSREFGSSDLGTFGSDDGYDRESSLDSNLRDAGSIRWTAGPPAKSRDDRSREDGVLAGSPPAGSDGYAQWQDDPLRDWQDEPSAGLLSRRFGQGGGDEPPGRRGGRSSRREARGRKRRRFRGKAASTLAILMVILVIGAAVFIGYHYVHRFIVDRYGNYKGQGTGTVEITVGQGANLVGLGPTLLKDRVIMALRPYDTAAAAAQGTALQPGVYRLHMHMNAAIAVQYLLSSKYRASDTITIIEGTRATAIAAQLSKKTGIPVSQFTQIIQHPPAALGLPSWAQGTTAEGFLFPDTYTLAPNESALQILQNMVNDFKRRTAPLNLITAAKKVNTTAWHVLIVASMVQAESGPGDFGKVARVAWNRLIMGMALHFDSTVFYGLNIPGNPMAAATAKEIATPNPYNTYMNKGLPPGPIGNPGVAAIKAAVHPPHGHWLYFITDLKVKPPVTHFTASYQQFLTWQQQFQG